MRRFFETASTGEIPHESMDNLPDLSTQSMIEDDFSMTEQDIYDFFADDESAGQNSDEENEDDTHSLNFVERATDSSEEKDFSALEFLNELHSDAQKASQVYEKNVTVERFSQGADVAVGIINSLGSFLGACGPLCMHGVGQIANAGASLSSATSGFSGISVGGLDVRSDGSFSWNGNISDLASAARVSPQDITSGRVSPEMLWQNIFGSYLGNSLDMVFGFGLISALVDMLLPGNVHVQREEQSAA